MAFGLQPKKSDRLDIEENHVKDTMYTKIS